MAYQDLRILSFSLTPSEINELHRQRYENDAAIRLGLETGDFDTFIVLNPDLAEVLSSIYQSDKRLTILAAKVPGEALEQFLTKSMIDEIQQSNEVENVDSTKKEIKDAVTAVKTGKPMIRFTSMVRKYMYIQSGTDIPLKTCQDIRNLYDEFLLDEVLREDKRDKPDGVIFRKEPVHIANKRGENIHEGLYPESKIINAMDTALRILNDEKIDILIRAACFHYYFGYIHPFYNGNGRMARFISSYVLSDYFSNAACLRISYVIKTHRHKYYALFKEANDKRNKGELTGFVKGWLLFFQEAINDTYSILQEKYSMYNKYAKQLSRWLDDNMPKISSAQKVCFTHMLQSDMFGDPVNDIENISKMMECSIRTARRVLTDAGSLVTTSREGRKQFWHINLDTLAE